METTRDLCISNDEAAAAQALELTDEFIKQQGLEGRKAMHLRLLAEETIGMVRAMTGDFEAIFRLEHADGEYKVRLTANTRMSREKKDSLLSVSTSGKNASVRGLMGKVGEIIENGLLDYNDVMKLQQKFGNGYLDYAAMGFGVPGELSVNNPQFVWSLSNYKSKLEDAAGNDDVAKEAWDELEESIVASLADDVTVGVKKDRVDMTIRARLD
ncbi:MAG: hypothetical protein K6F34_05975 [Lachnospiraceae bacterium]|nr:hypothetical protein [Lachnospiraceae bacterium]